MTRFDFLFTPIDIGPMRVPNRIAETTNSIDAGRNDGLPDAPFIAHHVAKARGGTGWIGNETWLLNSPLPPGVSYEWFPGAAALRRPVYRFPKFVERVKAFTDAVREAGAVSVMQLTHLNSTFGPSPVQMSLAYDWIPRELEEDEIEFIINTYADAAEAFRAAGADGLEVHAAHETLPHFFLSPYTNKRTDKWGGTLEKRTQFLRAVIRRVRERIGRDLAVGVRICADEYRDGGYDLNDMREMIPMITSEGIDFVSADVGSGWGLPSYVQPMQVPLAAFAEVAAAIRETVEPVPVLYAGRVNDPVLAERLLAEGQCDIVGMTRAGIADPEFPIKAREGKLDEIRKCIACNTCIGETIHRYSPIRKASCAVNPEIGAEERWQKRFQKASEPKRIVVVGGGAAGLEAARVAAARGHRVTLLEKRRELGGQLLIAARAPAREGFVDFPRYEEIQMKLLGVDVRLGEEVTADAVLALSPQAVVCATGSVPIIPEIPGVDSPNVHQAWDVLEGTAECGERVAVLSEEDHMETISVADYLASKNKKVEIFHKWLYIGSEVDRYTRGIVFHRLSKGGVVVHPSRRARRIEGRTLVAADTHTGDECVYEGFDSFVLSCGSRPEVSLYRALRGHVAELYLVGSAWTPRRLYEATQHGANVGLEL